tara:strand:+ start:230 stop:505 length:276 start_codon:yes stop_codon:yes gene_type:complete
MNEIIKNVFEDFNKSQKTTNVKTPENIWREYSDKQNKDYLKLYKETNRVKADTQILVHKIEMELYYEQLENDPKLKKVKELLNEIIKINKL